MVQHLAGLLDAKVKITLEIDADMPSGAPEDVVRTLTENCRTLKFDSQGFEDVYSPITAQIVECLGKGVRPWSRPWNAEHAAGRVTRPLRFNGQEYSGINVLSLWMSARPRWVPPLRQRGPSWYQHNCRIQNAGAGLAKWFILRSRVE